jgi:hypothetical protein
MISPSGIRGKGIGFADRPGGASPSRAHTSVRALAGRAGQTHSTGQAVMSAPVGTLPRERAITCFDSVGSAENVVSRPTTENVEQGAPVSSTYAVVA